MSPTVRRIGPYRLFFYSNEGSEPPHIHVQRERKVAKFWLNPVELSASTGFASHELRRIQGIVEENEADLHEAWRKFFRR